MTNFLASIKNIEEARKVLFSNIDIIDFKNEVKKTKELILPHPRCHSRLFVLSPIFQIDPSWSHPILKKNAQFLINKLSYKFRIEITRLQKNVNIKI